MHLPTEAAQLQFILDDGTTLPDFLTLAEFGDSFELSDTFAVERKGNEWIIRPDDGFRGSFFFRTGTAEWTLKVTSAADGKVSLREEYRGPFHKNEPLVSDPLDPVTLLSRLVGAEPEDADDSKTRAVTNPTIQARVLSIEGQRCTLDKGLTNGLLDDDQLVVYRRDAYGRWSLVPVELRVVNASDLRASCEVADPKLLRIGDVATFSEARRREFAAEAHRLAEAEKAAARNKALELAAEEARRIQMERDAEAAKEAKVIASLDQELQDARTLIRKLKSYPYISSDGVDKIEAVIDTAAEALQEKPANTRRAKKQLAMYRPAAPRLLSMMEEVDSSLPVEVTNDTDFNLQLEIVEWTNRKSGTHSDPHTWEIPANTTETLKLDWHVLSAVKVRGTISKFGFKHTFVAERDPAKDKTMVLRMAPLVAKIDEQRAADRLAREERRKQQEREDRQRPDDNITGLIKLADGISKLSKAISSDQPKPAAEVPSAPPVQKRYEVRLTQCTRCYGKGTVPGFGKTVKCPGCGGKGLRDQIVPVYD